MAETARAKTHRVVGGLIYELRGRHNLRLGVHYWHDGTAAPPAPRWSLRSAGAGGKVGQTPSLHSALTTSWPLIGRWRTCARRLHTPRGGSNACQTIEGKSGMWQRGRCHRNRRIE